MRTALYSIPDSLSPAERIREFEDIEKGMNIIKKEMLAQPDAFPNGVTMKDPDNDFTLSMYVDEKGVYCAAETKGTRAGVTFDELVELSKRHYLLCNNGLELLISAVCALGKEKRFSIGENTLVITSLAGEVYVKYQ